MDSKSRAGWFSTSVMWLAVGALSLFAGLPLAASVGGLTIVASAIAVEAAGLTPNTSAYETAALVGLACATLAGLFGFAGGIARGLRGDSDSARGAFISRRPFLSLFIGSALAAGAVGLLGRPGSSETTDALVVVGAPALLVASVAAILHSCKAWLAGAVAAARFGRASTSRALTVATAGSALTLVLMASTSPVEAARGLGRATPVLQALEASEHWSTEEPFPAGTLALPFARGGGHRSSPEALRFEDCVEQLAPEQEGALGGAVVEARRMGEPHFGREAAWDLAMGTLVDVCEEYQARHIADLRPYYFGSLRNAFRKNWRARQYQSRFAQLEGGAPEPGEPSAYDALVKARDLQCLREARRSLPARDQEVLEAVDRHEFHTLVARSLRISEATARQRYRRAVGRLKEEIQLKCQ